MAEAAVAAAAPVAVVFMNERRETLLSSIRDLLLWLGLFCDGPIAPPRATATVSGVEATILATRHGDCTLWPKRGKSAVFCPNRRLACTRAHRAEVARHRARKTCA